jgi:hypothetical protein
MGPFGLVYAPLVEHGYAVLPIMPGTKKPGLPFGDGKWMDFPGWPTFQPTLVHLKLWALSSAGIGVLCGPRSGYLVVIDIDTDNPGILEALYEILPATPVKKKGARGESWFYFGPDIPSRAWLINGCKVVEILGAGRQTVLPPTIHPDLGEPYRWTSSKTLEELRPEELPRLPIEIIERISEVLVPFGYAPPVSQSRRGEHNGGSDGAGEDGADTPHRRLNEDALANLAAWVPALDLYRCRPTRQGYEAVATWRESTEGRKKEKRSRNLKIASHGIRDFGADKGYTAIDLVMAAKECDLEAAFDFLDEQLRWSGDNGEVLLKLETLGLSEPDENPNETPSSETTNGKGNGKGNGSAGADFQAFDATGAHTTEDASGGVSSDASSDAQASAQEGAQVIPLFKPAVRGPFVDSGGGGGLGGGGPGSGPPSGGDPTASDPLEPYTYVPGLVGEIIDWIVANARRPNRVLALAAALIVVGTLIGRRCMGPTGTATHLYPMIIAPVSGGKEWICEAIRLLLEAAGAGAHVHPGEITAQSSLDETLLAMPMGAIVIDEFHNFLGRAVNPKAGGWERGLIGQFNKLWGKNFTEYRTLAKVGNPSKVVRSPAISLFGASTPDNFWPLLSGAEILNGFFSRLLVFESHVRAKSQKPPVPPKVPDGLKARLAEIYQFGKDPMEMAQLIDSNIEFVPQVQPWTSGAEAACDRLDARIDCEIAADPSKREYLGRLVEQAMRLTTIRAAGIAGHRAKVDVADMDWGADLATAAIANMVDRSLESQPETPRSQAAGKMVKLIHHRGVRTVREIQQYFRSAYRSPEINDILVQSVMSGVIVKTLNGYASRPGPRRIRRTRRTRSEFRSEINILGVGHHRPPRR